MTSKQRRWYFREWNRVKAACEKSNLPCPDRHEFHIRALGSDKSSNDFNNDDLDDVIAEFKTCSEPSNVNEQLRLADGRRIRTRHRIKTLAPVAYREAIMRDRFGNTRLDDLTLEELVQLRNTLCARKPSR